MKTASLTGFNAYTISEDGTIKNGKKTVKAKDGVVKLTASEDAEGIEKGKDYKYAVKDILEVITAGNGWIEQTAPASETKVDTPAVELTDEQKEAIAHREKVKEAKKAVQALKDEALEKGTPDNIAEYQQKIKDAQEVVDELTKKVKEEAQTPEQLEAIAVYEAKFAAWQLSKEAMQGAQAEAMAAKEKAKEIGAKIDGKSVAERAPHLNYEIAQKVRAMYAIGRYGNSGTEVSLSDIAAKFGCSPQAVGYMVNYLQHKLRRDDTRVIDGVEMNKPYTPLINKFYNEHPMSGFPKGAPYYEDKIAETNGRYVLPETRTERAISTKGE